MSLPAMTIDLVKRLNREFPARCPRPHDYTSKVEEAKMLMYAGKRELIEWMLHELEDGVSELPILNR